MEASHYSPPRTYRISFRVWQSDWACASAFSSSTRSTRSPRSCGGFTPPAASIRPLRSLLYVWCA